MEFRTVLTKAEQAEAVELSKSIFKDNMGEQFTLLFSESNWKHMFIAIDKAQIVSLVNYYPTFIKIGPSIVKAASVGSVCTKKEYRGQKLASNLLKLAEQKMKEESIDLVIISGAGGLYADFGASLAGNVYEYYLDKTQFPVNENLNITLYNNYFFNILADIQNQENVRYIRNSEEFNQLLTSQTFPDTFANYPIYLIEDKNKPVAYIVGYLPTEGNEFGIKEFAGNRDAIVQSLRLLANRHHRDMIHFAADIHDSINQILSGLNRKVIHQHASFKILDFVNIMDKLKPYFDSVYPNNGIKYGFINNKATFIHDDEIYTVDSSHQLSQILLGFDQPLNLKLETSPSIKVFFDKVFPIPFVWTNNLNYQ